MQVKAEIARPAEGETVPANTNVCVSGAAWACNAEITKVELSTDGGVTWNDAKLLGESNSNAWRLWEFDWQTPSQLGKQTLIARATDLTRPNATIASRSRPRHVYDQSPAADRSRSEVATTSRLRKLLKPRVRSALRGMTQSSAADRSRSGVVARFWGAHASRRAGFGVAPKRTFLFSRSRG